MKPRKPMVDDLFDPLLERYRPTQTDRERLQAKIRARLAAPGASAQASASPSAGSSSGPGLTLSSLRRWGWLGSGVLALAGMTLTLAVHGAGDDSSGQQTVSSRPALPGTTALPSIASRTATPEEVGGPLKTAPASTAPVPVQAPALDTGVRVAAPPSAKRAAAPRVASNQNPPVPAESDALERETNLWRQANRARNDGQWAEALRLLDQHAREFPHGVLAVERTVERIVVLCHLGRREEARESSAFLAAHPDSALRRRVESTCGYEPASPPSTSSSARPSQEPANTLQTAPKNTSPGTLNEGPEQAP